MPLPPVHLEYDTRGSGLARGERVVWTHEEAEPQQSPAAWWVAAGVTGVVAAGLGAAAVVAGVEGRVHGLVALLTAAGATAFACYWLAARGAARREDRAVVRWTLTTHKLVRRPPGDEPPAVAPVYRLGKLSWAPRRDAGGRSDSGGGGSVGTGIGEISNLSDPRGTWILLLRTRTAALLRLRPAVRPRGERNLTAGDYFIMTTTTSQPPVTPAVTSPTVPAAPVGSTPPPVSGDAPPAVTEMLDTADGEALLWWARPLPDPPRVRAAIVRSATGLAVSVGAAAVCVAWWWYGGGHGIVLLGAAVAGLIAMAFAGGVRDGARLPRRTAGPTAYAVTDRRLLGLLPDLRPSAAGHRAVSVPLDVVTFVTTDRRPGNVTVDVEVGWGMDFEQIALTDADAARVVTLILAARARWVKSLGGPPPLRDDPGEEGGGADEE